jgi:hypothetical protein
LGVSSARLNPARSVPELCLSVEWKLHPGEDLGYSGPNLNTVHASSRDRKNSPGN